LKESVAALAILARCPIWDQGSIPPPKATRMQGLEQRQVSCSETKHPGALRCIGGMGPSAPAMGALVVGTSARVAVALRDKRPAAPRGHRLAREAEAWLRENLTEPLTIRDVCSALHASERTLHAAFREHVGTTPKAFVKVLRLRAARQDLLHPGPNTRVTDVALRWCLLHFGWFAHDYHALFGETPSRTLRRATLDAAMAERAS
jgi:AraC-like DNA-binding protein